MTDLLTLKEGRYEVYPLRPNIENSTTKRQNWDLSRFQKKSRRTAVSYKLVRATTDALEKIFYDPLHIPS